RPVLKGSVSLPGVIGHGTNFAPDGRTYYGTSWGALTSPSAPESVFAVDVSDPSKPREIARWKPDKEKIGEPHHVSISPDGTRAYATLFGKTANGVVILDVSDIQSRRPNPQFRMVHRQVWEDAGSGQGTMQVTIKGHPYLITTDASARGGTS